MVQNMSIFTCPNCFHTTHIFGNDGVHRECQKRGIDLLGNIPLHPGICEDADKGKPSVVADPQGANAMAFLRLAETVDKKLFKGI
jgi:ATP-binding protein involved in chromosome partitioning